MSTIYFAKIPFSVSIEGLDQVSYKKGAKIADEHVKLCHESLIRKDDSKDLVKEAAKAEEARLEEEARLAKEAEELEALAKKESENKNGKNNK